MYEKYFGFADLPFRVTPEPRIFYSNPIYREAFEILRHGVEARKGFIVITGEVGTGKTTLLKMFIQNTGPAIHTAFIFNPHVTFAELLRLICKDLGIAEPPEDKFTLMERFNDYLIQQHKNGHVVALLLDEAQGLSESLLEELRLFSNFETDKEKLVQIVLMGQPELEERLARPELRQLKQRVALRCRLVPLKSDEIRDYIDFRLRAVGYEGKELFDRNAVERIALYSMGIPRLINVICDNALLFAYADSKNKVSAEIIERVACSLQLMLPSRFQIPPDTDLRRSNNRPEETINETKPAEFEMAEAPDEFHSRRSPAGRGLGMLLALLLVASGSALLYSQQMRNYFWDVAVGVPDFIEKQVETFKPGRLMSKISETGSSSGALSTNGNASPEVDRIPASQHAPHGRAPRLSDSNDVHRAAPKKLPVKQDRTDDVAPVAKGSEAAQPRLPPPGPRASVKEGPKPQRIEPQLHSARNESVRLAFQKNSEKERRFFVGTFEVTGDSLVYDKPQRRAAPVTTLQPGTWVRVENKIGDYLRVRSLNDPGVRGYMRLEEALLQRIG